MTDNRSKSDILINTRLKKFNSLSVIITIIMAQIFDEGILTDLVQSSKPSNFFLSGWPKMLSV